jgi:bacterioferritin (cytochrome b1)
MRNEVKMDSLYQRLSASRLSDSERRAAIQAMQHAEVIADAILWVTRKIEQLGARLFLKPSPKH